MLEHTQLYTQPEEPPLFGDSCVSVTPTYQLACCQQDAQALGAGNDAFCKATFPQVGCAA